MKQLFFKIKKQLKNAQRFAYHTLYIYRIKRQSRLYIKGVRPIRKYGFGLHKASYACDMYKYKDINVWQTLISLNIDNLNPTSQLITDTINEAYLDGFIYEDEYISAIRETQYFFRLIKKYPLIYKLM